jgi:hypothetical protein
LLPGEVAGFQNYTSFEKGINGIIVEILDPAHDPLLGDFYFRAGNSEDPSGWRDVPPTVFDVTTGSSGVPHRVTLIWNDHTIEGEWLQVTVRSDTGNLGLDEDDVFYFGNAPGEAGDSPTNAIVNGTDEAMARMHTHGPRNPASLDDPYDYNRDGLVNATDRLIARNNRTGVLTALRLITAPPLPGGQDAAPVENETDAVVPRPRPDDERIAKVTDVVLERAEQRDSSAGRTRGALSSKLTWLLDPDLQQIGGRRAARKTRSVERAVDRLFGSSWR